MSSTRPSKACWKASKTKRPDDPGTLPLGAGRRGISDNNSGKGKTLLKNDTAAPSREISRVGIMVVTVCTMLATLMQALDSTIANVALPYMQGTMAASQDEINWVLTSYIVTSAIMTAPTGFLTSRFGRTRLFIISITGFTLASVLCGMAQSLDQIVIFRILQGGFGAALVPLSQSVLYEIYPVEKRGWAMALWGMGVQVGPVLGPILGGWLTENYSWRWVFYVNVPFGILAAVGLLTYMNETAHSKTVKIDWIGFGALSLAVGAFQIMLDRGEQLDWLSSPEIITEACLAGLGLYLFVVQSALAPKPFLSPKLFTDVNFAVGLVFIFIVGLTVFATLALQAPYLQTLMNYPVFTAGIVLAPRGVGTMLAMLLAGRLVGKVDVRPLIALGFVLTAYSVYEMTQWTPDVSEWTIIRVGLAQGVGVGFVSVPLSVVIFSTLPASALTEATGIYSLMRNLGSAIGISVTGALLQTYAQINHASIAAGVTPFNRAFQSGVAARFWSPETMSGAAALNQEVTRQAMIIGYVNDFKLMFLLSVIALPFVLVIRPTAQAPQQGHAAAMD
jgi:MFS transporter, DHA2 family, multidrug resistance protein